MRGKLALSLPPWALSAQTNPWCHYLGQRRVPLTISSVPPGSCHFTNSNQFKDFLQLWVAFFSYNLNISAIKHSQKVPAANSVTFGHNNLNKPLQDPCGIAIFRNSCKKLKKNTKNYCNCKCIFGELLQQIQSLLDPGSCLMGAGSDVVCITSLPSVALKCVFRVYVALRRCWLAFYGIS